MPALVTDESEPDTDSDYQDGDDDEDDKDGEDGEDGDDDEDDDEDGEDGDDDEDGDKDDDEDGEDGDDDEGEDDDDDDDHVATAGPKNPDGRLCRCGSQYHVAVSHRSCPLNDKEDVLELFAGDEYDRL